ncbi:hypothetical protein DFH07DRAFT_763752 [Mycena maculata]|uniref:Uncharacterized protein n=1 Tax=Mycena maculata TaxID=230809 RepID=A0AAD7KGJ0_9AGAR|nr:hypothetical protein DFH07DRAFT_763752 [Mycena maculata]
MCTLSTPRTSPSPPKPKPSKPVQPNSNSDKRDKPFGQARPKTLAISAAEKALELTDHLTTQLVNAAIVALDGVTALGKPALELASWALEKGKDVAALALAGAQKLLDGLKSCGEWLAYEAATIALQTAKAAGSGTLLLAEGGVLLANEGEQVVLRASAWILSHFMQFIDITDITLTGELSKAYDNIAFWADVKGTVSDDHFFHFNMEFHPHRVSDFIKELFDKLTDLIKDGILDTAKALDSSLDSVADAIHNL